MTQTQGSQAKVCTRCKLEIEVSSFYLTQYGTHSSWCKQCYVDDSRERYWKRKAAGTPRVYILTEEQKEKKRLATLEWKKRNPDKVRAIKLKHEKNNKERVAELARLRGRKMYRKKASNPDKYASDLLAIRLRNRFSRFIVGGGAGRLLTKVISYTVDELKTHLEAQFEPGMTWSNRGDWHIDHIRPLSSFENKLDPSAWDLPNLRPIWASENLKKSWKLQLLL